MIGCRGRLEECQWQGRAEAPSALRAYLTKFLLVLLRDTARDGARQQGVGLDFLVGMFALRGRHTLVSQYGAR